MLYGLFHPAAVPRAAGRLRGLRRPEDGLVKRIAKPHQYFAVSKAVGKTVEAARSNGHAGVVWHTQGSGKSMEMELYAHQVLRHPALGNPTIVVLTDRTDLDDQLYDTFDASELLPGGAPRLMTREVAHRAGDRRTGGIMFSTLQKFGRTKEEKRPGRTIRCCPTGATSS